VGQQGGTENGLQQACKLTAIAVKTHLIANSAAWYPGPITCGQCAASTSGLSCWFYP
jgi:hypothetical protein